MSHLLTRRSFLRVAGGAVSITGLGACSRDAALTETPSTIDSATSAPAQTIGAEPPSTTSPPSVNRGDRRLVVVQLLGGNDLLNTLPPLNGTYRDLRPALAIPEADLVALAGVDDAALHPSLAALTTMWDDGSLALLRGIGFAEANRSHFVSMDRWWRADDVAAAGWIGRAVDLLDGPLPPLYGTVLGGGAPLLVGERFRPTSVSSRDAFQLESLDPSWLSFGAGRSDLDAAARGAIASAVAAMEDFAGLVEDAPESADLPEFAGGSPISDGLATAAALLAGDVGCRVVVVSAGGFDTHSGQLGVHADLLDDLAAGLVLLRERLSADGLADDVLVAVTSEFGRRAAENGSGGTDHGSAGLSLLMGSGVRGGMYGEVDLRDLVDGDVRPTIDPLVLYTACLDWLGADAMQVLGRRDDSVSLLR